MRLPRPRFTLRGLIVAVAVLAVAFAAQRRWAYYRRMAAYHAQEAARIRHDGVFVYSSGPGMKSDSWWAARFREAITERDRAAEIHARMSRRYAHAAFHPWEMVAPDPPPPP
jgi:hypothetical protein